MISAERSGDIFVIPLKPSVRVAAFSLALALSLGVAVFVFRGHVSHWLVVLWLLSLFPFAFATHDRPDGTDPRFRSRTRWILPLVAILLPVLVRVAHIDLSRQHTDEFITAYFSANHDFNGSSFFGYMPEEYEWNAQFPKLFFFNQRLFFSICGASLLTLRLSIQIYVAIVSLMLFLIVRDLFDQTLALIAVCLYSFLAVSVYMESLGFMFISSTAIFMVFFYFGLREYRNERVFDAAMAGVACGFCYLTYYSSYLAFPVLVAFTALHFARRRRMLVFQNFLIALGGMLLVLAPFAAAGVRGGNSVTRRASEISLLTGSWSPHREAIAHGVDPVPIIKDNLLLSLRAFARDGIGGHGGYDFGHLAFFDRFSLGLFLTGCAMGLILMFWKTDLFFVYLVIAAAFFVGVVLTIPPPAYHRFSIAFPFLTIVMSLPFALLWRLPKLPASIRYAMAGGALLVFACVNERQFVEAVFRDAPPNEALVCELLNQRFRERKVYVAAFPGFAFHRVLYFCDGRHRRAETEYHTNLLARLDASEPYVYVVILVEHFRESFQRADPKGRFFTVSPAYSLFAN